MADMEKLGNADNSFLTGVIHGIEEKLEEVSRKSVIWEAVSDQVTKRIRVEHPILFSKTRSLEATIGKRVKNEMPGSQAPTVWGSIASLNTMIHDTQTKVHDTNQMSAVLKDDIKEDVGKYIELKLQSTGVSQTMKTELINELSQYVESKVLSEMTQLSNGVKRLKGEIYSTVELIAARIHQESQQTEALRARLDQLEQ
jgi:hypothetical protein